MGKLAFLDKEKAKVPNNLYASVFNSRYYNHDTKEKKGKCRD